MSDVAQDSPGTTSVVGSATIDVATDNDLTKAIRLLSWFVVRARRVELHSLTADLTQLRRWADGTFVGKQIGKEIVSIRWDLPDEEPLESLAARCRPFILPTDTLGWQKVVDAVELVLERKGIIEPYRERLAALTVVWKGLDRKTSETLGYTTSVSTDGSELGPMYNDRDLAYAWIYGDLIHADDDIPDRVGKHDINARFQAGSILIARTAWCVLHTLDLIRAVQSQHDLQLEGDALTRRVTARPHSELAVTQYASAPAGTTFEQLAAQLDTANIAPVTKPGPARAVAWPRQENGI